MKSSTILLYGWAVFCVVNSSLSARADEPASEPSEENLEIGSLNSLSIEQLLDIRVTGASKVDELAFDAPGIIEVITRDELNRFGGTSLRDILERVSGVIGSSGEVSDRASIVIRGDQLAQSTNHVLFLLNGRPIREVEEGGVLSDLYKSFPVGVIDRIEIIKGPGSVLYGSNAMSGVVNVITTEASRTGASVSVMEGLPTSFGFSGEATLKVGDMGIVAAARRFKSEPWSVDYKYTGFAAGQHEKVAVPDQGEGAYLGLSYKGLRLNSGLVIWDNSSFAPALGAIGRVQWAKYFADLGYSADLFKQWTTSFNITYNRSLLNLKHPATGFTRDSSEVLAEWTNTIRVIDELRFVVGGLFSTQTGEEISSPTQSLIANTTRRSFAFYAEGNFAPIEQLTLVAGVQANRIQNLNVDLGVRGGFIWHPTSSFSIKAFYSEAYRAPSIDESSLNFMGLMGNPDLNPEKVRTIDVSLGYKTRDLQLALNGFVSMYRQSIGADFTKVPISYVNMGETTIAGGELEAKRYFNREIYVTSSVAYQRSTDTKGTWDITSLPTLEWKFGPSYQSASGITLSLFNILQTRLPKKYQNGVNPSAGTYDVLSVHANVEIDKFFNLESKLRKPSIFIQIDNAFNQQIWLPCWSMSPEESMPFRRGVEAYLGFKVGI
jgi:outer membrane receptor for ferrienterochelin and colicins